MNCTAFRGKLTEVQDDMGIARAKLRVRYLE